MNCTSLADLLNVGSFLGPLPSNMICSMVSMKTPKSIQRAQTSFLSPRSANVTTYPHFHLNVPNVPQIHSVLELHRETKLDKHKASTDFSGKMVIGCLCQEQSHIAVSRFQ